MARSLFAILRYMVNTLLLLSAVLLLVGVVWEYSTRQYLHGFGDAIVPNPASPEEKVEAILAWMEKGPVHRNPPPEESLIVQRDPRRNLNYSALLRVCGSATNAFINLATSSDLDARRLLLLDPNRNTKHVVAEVLVDGRWVVVDPMYRTLFRDARGRPLAREQLRDPAVLREATRKLSAYNPDYTYELTVHVRLGRIPVVGRFLRRNLDRFFPAWEERINWTLPLERSSSFFTVLATIGLFVCLLARAALGWYGRKRLGSSGAGI
jgi:hypothetical protein